MDQKITNYLPIVVCLGTWLWDAWCQAHSIPYVTPDWVKGVILWSYGKKTYLAVRTKIAGVLAKKEPTE